jgi:uncharacterized membrane protein
VITLIGSEPALRRAQVVLAAIGVAIAAYITIADSGGGAPACLAGGDGCQTVADSSYSSLAGVDVSVIGIAGYALLLGAALWGGDGGRFAGLALALVGFGFSLYLTYLELFVIDAVCQWCVASAVVMTLTLTVAAARALGFVGTEAARLEVGVR